MVWLGQVNMDPEELGRFLTSRCILTGSSSKVLTALTSSNRKSSWSSEESGILELPDTWLRFITSGCRSCTFLSAERNHDVETRELVVVEMEMV